MRNNRFLQLNRKRFEPFIRRRRYNLQPGNIIELQKGRYSVIGMHCYGKQVIIRNGEKKVDVSMKKARMVRYGKGLQFQSRFLSIPVGVSSS